MTGSLIEAFEKVKLSAERSPWGEDGDESHLFKARPHKRLRTSPEKLKESLESEFLTPPKTFSTAWLNRLQRYFIQAKSY